METTTIAGTVVSPITVENIESLNITKPALLAHCKITGIPVSPGPISKTDLIDLIVDHYENLESLTVTKSEPTIMDNPALLAPEQEPEVTKVPEPELSVPTQFNIPNTLTHAWCKTCHCHVLRKGTFPTTEGSNVVKCMKACVPGTGTTMAQKAAEASKNATTSKSAKTAPRTTKFADTDVITNIIANPKKVGSASYAPFVMYREGMTVAEYLKLVADGRGRLNWDSERNFIAIVTSDKYASMNTEPS